MTSLDKLYTGLENQIRDGLFKQAAATARKILDTLEPGQNDEMACAAWASLLKGLERMSQEDEIDECIEKYPGGKFSRCIPFLAAFKQKIPDTGYMIDGVFHRGFWDGHGEYVNCSSRDRVRRLQILAAAIPDAENCPDPVIRGRFFLNLARFLLQDCHHNQAYRLQAKTDLTVLPDYNLRDDLDSSISRAPVNPDGTPVFYSVPVSFDAAVNDGERFRYAAARAEAAGNEDAALLYAKFLYELFDSCGSRSRYGEPGEREQLYQLKDNESIAELADGIRKITLPPDSVYIEIFRRYGYHLRCAEIYMARMQYERAAEEYRLAGDKKKADDIESPVGFVDDVDFQIKGKPWTLPYTFRNAPSVRIELFRMDPEAVLKTYLWKYQKDKEFRSYFHFRNMLWEPDFIKAISRRGLHELPEKVFHLPLEPLPHHWDRTVNLDLPEQPDGFLWLARFIPMGPNNLWLNKESESETLLWKSSAILSEQHTADGIRFFLNDSETGEPLADVPIDLYILHEKDKKRDVLFRTTGTDRSGIAEVSIPEDLREDDFAVIPAAHLPSGELVLLSDTRSDWYDFGVSRPEMKLFVSQDRPIYRPGDEVCLSFYPRIPDYSRPAAFDLNLEFELEIEPPRGDALPKVKLPFDPATGSLEYRFELPDDAETGRWSVQLYYGPSVFSSKNHFFTVEEYKKPEYELRVIPPEKNPASGEKFRFRLQADYFFGAPLAGENIRYRVTCRECYDFLDRKLSWDWYRNETTLSGIISWKDSSHFYGNFEPWDVVSSEVETGPDGSAVVEIDSSKEFNGRVPVPLEYVITAEVEDSSGRTVSASGSIRLTADIFAVELKTDWGFVRCGEPAKVETFVQVPSGAAGKLTGRAELYRCDPGPDGRLQAQTVPEQSFEFDPAAGSLVFTPGEAGCFLLKTVLSDGCRSTESEIHFPAYGPGFEQKLYPSGDEDIEICSDRSVFRAGETAELLITCVHPDAVLYFNIGKEGESEILCRRMTGHAMLIELPLTERHRPNLFIQVMSVFAGDQHTREVSLILPPEDKKLQVSAAPDPVRSLPDQTAMLRLKVTDPDGKPLAGSSVTAAVYDLALESLVSRSWVDDVFNTFWRWTNDSPENWQRIGHSIGCRFPNPKEYSTELTSGRHIFFSRQDEGRDCFLAPSMSLSPNVKCLCEIHGMPDGAAQDDTDEMPSSVTVRSEFADRIFWLPARRLPEDGMLEIPVKLPDNLTTWKIRVWSVAPDAKAGEAESEIVVSKDFIVRLELPRFMTCGDRVNAVATIHNYTDRVQSPKVELSAEGLLDRPFRTSCEIPADGKVSFPVEIHAGTEGEFKLRLAAWTSDTSDAVELSLPVQVKGFGKQVNRCGVLDRSNSSVCFTLPLPEERRKETTAFALNVSPGLLRGIMELLPYLSADGSDKDIFFTLNRLLPPVSVLAVLKKTGLSEDSIPREKTGRDKLYADYLKRFSGSENPVPVFEPEQIRKNIHLALKELADEANEDGGWSWFSGGRSSFDTTAAVVASLLDCMKPDEPPLAGGIGWLEKYADERLKDKDLPPGTEADCTLVRVLAKAGKIKRTLRSACYARRLKFSPHGVASLALAYEPGSEEESKLSAMLREYLETDPETGGAYLRIPDCYSIFWYGDKNETLAMFLSLLVRNDPDDPLAARIARHLLCSLRNSPWRNSIRALGMGIRTLAEYLVKNGELQSDFSLRVSCGGKTETFRYTPENLLTIPETVLYLGPEELHSGELETKLEFSGNGTCIWNAMLNYFSLEDEVRPEGLELKIKRNYYRVAEVDQELLHVGAGGQLADHHTTASKRIPLGEDESVASGEIIEVELIAEAKNDYDYVVLESPMPAGFEYADPRSGWEWNWRAPVYRSCRERTTRFYLHFMPQGRSSFTFRIRAQLEGKVTALPAQGRGVYAPALKCNGNLRKFVVR